MKLNKFLNNIGNVVSNVCSSVGTNTVTHQINGVTYTQTSVGGNNTVDLIGGQTFINGKLVTKDNIKHEELKVEVKSFVNNISRMSIDTSFLDIILNVDSSIKETTVESNLMNHLDVSKSNGTLKVQQHGFMNVVIQGRVYVKITSPTAIIPNIELSSSSGDIKIEEYVVNKLKNNTSSGDIEIIGCEVKSLTFIASSGDIRVQDGKIESITGITSSGDIDVIECETENVEFDYTLKASSGDIKCKFNKSTSVNIHHRVTSGEFRNRNKTHFDSHSKNNLHCSTSSGDITV